MNCNGIRLRFAYPSSANIPPHWGVHVCAVSGGVHGTVGSGGSAANQRSVNAFGRGFWCYRMSLAIQNGNAISLLGNVVHGSSLDNIFIFKYCKKKTVVE